MGEQAIVRIRACDGRCCGNCGDWDKRSARYGQCQGHGWVTHARQGCADIRAAEGKHLFELPVASCQSPEGGAYEARCESALLYLTAHSQMTRSEQQELAGILGGAGEES